ncbi:MAG: hypothetical protein JO257_13875, partial [Deltaproteobacteria bacterium]|nr:hypothetical protein [Deltaproteobacteria bacterium]
MRGAAMAVLTCLAGCEHAQSAASATPEPPCLADSLPALRLGWDNRVKECSAANQQCTRKCAAGDADACQSRGIAIERSPDTELEAQGLFERACKLGLATGCTNWAATVWAIEDHPPARCLLRTFEKTCAADDHFGCAMA